MDSVTVLRQNVFYYNGRRDQNKNWTFAVKCSVDFGLNLEAEFCELRLTGLEEQNAVKCHSWRRGRD